MEKAVGSIIAFFMSVVTAAFAALTLAYIAHYEFGLSRQDIRTPAVVGAAVIAMLVAVEFFRQEIAQAQLIISAHDKP